jgi:hypothetical protein
VRLDPRFALPAVLASVALAVPVGTAMADNEENVFCPNATDWTPWPAELAPQDKDGNGDGVVCKKITHVDEDNPTKDNNNPPDEFVDNTFPES